MRSAILCALAAIMILFFCGCSKESPRDHFTEADELSLKGDHQAAVQALQKYLNEFPSGDRRALALFRIGELQYYMLDERSAAVRSFSALVKQYPGSGYSFRAHEILAGAFRDETRNYMQAVFEYKWLLTTKPDNERAPQFQFQIARCYLLAGNYEEAVLEFGRFLKDYPQSNLTDRVLDELGGAYLVLGQPLQALYIYQKLLARNPKSPLDLDTEFKIGAALEDLHRYDDAYSQYEGLLERYHNKAAVEIRMAGVKNRQKKQQGKVKAVDYNYRPEENKETLKNFDE